MYHSPKEQRCKVIKDGRKRTIVLPDDFFLKDDEIIIRQDDDGLISIYPGTEEGREAMWKEFDMFSDWKE